MLLGHYAQQIHQYYNRVQDILLYKSIPEVVYILRPSGLQELSTSRSSRLAKKGRKRLAVPTQPL